MIAIVDYGVGNLASVRNAFERLGFQANIHSNPSEILGYERVVLPGVGSFRVAMESLNSLGWTPVLKEYAASGKPFLGICLGMQLLFDVGEEHGPTDGLGLIHGKVIKLTPAPPNKIPHVGWNNLTSIKPHPLFKGVKPNVDFYFVHSYQCVPARPEDALAMCDFGGEFAAAVACGNIAGMQFHPEKSQPAGMRLLENFAEWSPEC